MPTDAACLPLSLAFVTCASEPADHRLEPGMTRDQEMAPAPEGRSRRAAALRDAPADADRDDGAAATAGRAGPTGPGDRQGELPPRCGVS